MIVIEGNSVDEILKETCQQLLAKGVKRHTRGADCVEFPSPVTLVLHKPANRWISLQARKWGKFLPLVESLWIAGGRNDLAMVSHYLPRMKDFSDDGTFCRASYGPRFRQYQGHINQYECTSMPQEESAHTIDQLRYVVQCFAKDPHTRQATINIGDPVKDSFELTNSRTISHEKLATVDYPCTRGLQFIQTNGALDLIVNMRSNDLIWGASGVNIFNFTWMQEYVAHILQIPLGKYYHTAVNLHYYQQDNLEKMVQELADSPVSTNTGSWVYPLDKGFQDLASFDDGIAKLLQCEQSWRSGKDCAIPLEITQDPMLGDWIKILHRFHQKKNPDWAPASHDFFHPHLANIYR